METQITPELREFILQAISENEAARERERKLYGGSKILFKELTEKYRPLVEKRFNEERIGRSNVTCTAYQIIECAKRMARLSVGSRSNYHVLATGKGEEANRVASEILDALLKL